MGRKGCFDGVFGKLGGLRCLGGSVLGLWLLGSLRGLGYCVLPGEG